MIMKLRKNKANIALFVVLVGLLVFAPVWKYSVASGLENKALENVDVRRSYEGTAMKLMAEPPLANPVDPSTWFIASGSAKFERHVYVDDVKSGNILVKQEVKMTWHWNTTYYYLTSSPTPFTDMTVIQWENTTHVLNKDIDDPHHVESPSADRPRTGYSLFFPAHQREGATIEPAFVDDVNATTKLEFNRVIELKGLTAYEYTGSIQKDCTGTVGAFVSVSITISFEPLSGVIVEVSDKTVTYYADPSHTTVIGQIAFTETEDSLDKGVADAKEARAAIRIIELWLPIMILGIASIIAILLVHRSIERIPEEEAPTTA